MLSLFRQFLALFLLVPVSTINLGESTALPLHTPMSFHQTFGQVSVMHPAVGHWIQRQIFVDQTISFPSLFIRHVS